MSDNKELYYNFERFRLILQHDYIDSEGKAIPLDEPITAQCYIESWISQQYGKAAPSYILNELISRLTRYIEEQVRKESDNNE